MTESDTPKPNRFRQWLTHRKRGEENETFIADMEELATFRKTVEDLDCPACGKDNLYVKTFSRGIDGWQAVIACKTCDLTGAANSEGFKFENLHSTGRAAK